MFFDLYLNTNYISSRIYNEDHDSDDDENKDKEEELNNSLESNVDSSKQKKGLKRNTDVLINDTNPLLICPNTMKKYHRCDFCKCYQCHLKQVQKEEDAQVEKANMNEVCVKLTRHHSKRVQRARNISQGQATNDSKKYGKSDESVCNHIDGLTFFTDETFFSKSYKMRNKKNNDSNKSKIFLPTKCSFCNCEIVDKLSK